MIEHVYRYRPISAVLDEFHELENQEIYFSTTDELNDPMEGYKDIFWLGDKIIWRNFLKHYVFCLLETAGHCFVLGEEFDRSFVKKIVFGVPDALPQAPIRDVYNNVSTEFLREPVVEKFIEVMQRRTTPIRRNELASYLRALHGFGLHIVLREYRERGVLPQTAGSEPPPVSEHLRQHAMSMMEGVDKIDSPQYPQEQISEALFIANEATVLQLTLINECNLTDRDKHLAFLFLTSRFPTAYVAALDKLVHRDWYVACFAKTAENHSMWSTYAGGHRGVCLMFKTTANTEGDPTLTINRVTSVGGSRGGPITYGYSDVAHELEPVRYTAQYPSIDFFRSLGTISELHMNNFWYRGEDGSFSECRSAVYTDLNVWTTKYWQNFRENALYKTPEWSHEEECRIVIHSGFDMNTKEKRKLKYRFQDLAGIVFGVRTEMDDKIKIMRIVDKKCSLIKRDDFRFFEIRYLPTESRFQLFSLDLLKLKYARS